jgi:hypothetical protein
LRYKILHRGVPVGEVDLSLEMDPAVGTIDPLLGYESIRHQVRDSTRALRAMGVGAPAPGALADSSALSAGAALGRALELRDDRDGLVQTDFIELADWEGEPLRLTVWVRARSALSGVPAVRTS